MQNKKDEEDIQISTSALFNLLIKGQLIAQSISIVINLKMASYLRDVPKSVDELAKITTQIQARSIGYCVCYLYWYFYRYK